MGIVMLYLVLAHRTIACSVASLQILYCCRAFKYGGTTNNLLYFLARNRCQRFSGQITAVHARPVAATWLLSRRVFMFEACVPPFAYLSIGVRGSILSHGGVISAPEAHVRHASSSCLDFMLPSGDGHHRVRALRLRRRACGHGKRGPRAA